MNNLYNTEKASDYIFHIHFSASEYSKEKLVPLNDPKNVYEFDAYLPASEEDMDKMFGFKEKHEDAGHIIAKLIECGKYDLPIKDINVIDLDSLNHSAQMIAQMSDSHVKELIESMGDAEYEYDIQEKCERVLGQQGGMNQPL